MDIDELKAKLFKAMAHPSRLAILMKLIDGPQCVCKLGDDMEGSQPNLSQHLKVLREAGLVDSEKQGLNVHYRILYPEVKQILALSGRIIAKQVAELNQRLKENPDVFMA